MKGKKLFLLLALVPMVSGCGTYYPPYYWPAIEISIDEEFGDTIEIYYVTPVLENEGNEKRAVEYYIGKDDYANSYIYETVYELRYQRKIENFHGNNQNGEMVIRFYNSESESSYWVYIYDIYVRTSDLAEGEAYFTGNYGWINLYEFVLEIQEAADTYFPIDLRKTYYIDF
ncbi:MAG: hypothetical protein LUC16_03105 [Coprobacillus sp.]|nr:hypothetical protein [Coprobacillus sp.]